MPDIIHAQNAPYEVEFRCHFNSPDEAYEVLPFIRSCLQHRYTWTGTFYGLEFFRSGQLIRISNVDDDKDSRDSLAWKGPDTGKFANIRQEITEDITAGITDSTVFGLLGGKGNLKNNEEVIRELETLGHHAFMSWNGVDIYGIYEPYGINVKLMYCELIKWPWLVELEKMAPTLEEAIRCEAELKELSDHFKLDKYIIRDEPPTLLYEKVFGHKP